VEEREDEEFQVVDKRKSRAKETPSAPESAATPAAPEPAAQPSEPSSAGPEPAPEPAAGPEAERQAAEPANVYALLMWMVSLLYQQAWINMGLLADPATKQLNKDLVQARVAIDCVEFIIKQLEGHVEPKEMAELRSLLSNLQINFVTHSD